MDALFPRCAGLDVHKANVVACVRIVGPTGKVTKQVRTFSTVAPGADPGGLGRQPYQGHLPFGSVPTHVRAPARIT
jgi:hypothetical protein